MKRIFPLSLLAVLAGAFLPAQAEFKDYKFFNAATAPATINDVTFDGTRFWAVGDINGLLRSGSQIDGPGIRGLIFDPITLTGVTNRLTSVVGVGSGQLVIGAGTGTNQVSVGALYRISTNFAGTGTSATTIPESPGLNLGQVTGLTRAGTNLIRFGNRFAVGRYSLANLSGANPTNSPERVADISPFFEDYQKGVLVGANLILAGQYRGEPQQRGALSLSRDFGLTNAPAAAVTLFGTNETPVIQTVGTDGQNLYLSGSSNFVAVLENASARTSLPSATNVLWNKATNVATALTAIVPHAGVLFVAGADGVHQRSPGTAFLTSREKPSDIIAPVQSLAVATGGDLEDIVVGVSGANLIVGGPVPEPAIVGGHRLHFIDSDVSNVVTISNLVTASTTSQKSLAFDIYKIVDGINVGKVVTIGPLRSSSATGFDLVGFGTDNFNYGANKFEVVSRDVRTGIEGARTPLVVYRWPNPQAAHLGRAQGTDESNHYFQLGADYTNSAVSSFLYVTNQVIDNGRGQNLLLPVASANWFKLTVPVGQSVDGNNQIVLSNSLAGHELVATDVDRINLSGLAALLPGVHTFAVQSISKFPSPLSAESTNSYATNVTLFNVVVLRRPVAPSLDWTNWETGACVGSVDSKLLPSTNGAWALAMLSPNNAIAGTDPRLTANISMANWPAFATNALVATLPVSQDLTTRTVEVQSVSTNRDCGTARGGATSITLISRPTPQPPTLNLTGVRVGSAGVPVSRDFTFVSGSEGPTNRIQVGEGVVGNVVAQPIAAVENRPGYTVVTWTVSATNGATTSQTGGDLLFALPFNLATQTPGLYRLTARSSNAYTNALVTAHNNGVPTATANVVRTCSSPAVTAFEVEVRQRPPMPAVTVSGVGVYTNGSIEYFNPADSGLVVIGQDATRPEYRVTAGQVSGIGGTVWQTADWYLLTASGVLTNLAVNSTNFTPPVALTTPILGRGPSTNQIFAYAHSLDGSTGLVARVVTLIVTPSPERPSLLAGGFSIYSGSVLVAQSNVPVADQSMLTIAGTLPGIAEHRPTYSMTAQGTNALVADWYRTGTAAPLARGSTNFRPTAAQSPIGTNDYYAVARSTQGSTSILSTSFRLVVTGIPTAPSITANDVRVFNNFGDFLSTSNIPVLPTIRITDVVRDLVTENGQQPRPVFLAALTTNSTGADWYRVQGADRILVSSNSPAYRPTAAEAPPGTNSYEAVTRSLQGAASVPAPFQLVVTGPTAAPSLSVGQYFVYQNGAVARLDNQPLVANGSTIIADSIVGQPGLRRPQYNLTGPSNAAGADWYQITGSTSNRLSKNTTVFTPSPAQTPVGTNRFFAVARSTEGAHSLVTAFTLVVTPVPSAPSVLASDFLLPDAQGLHVLQAGTTLTTGTPLVIGDNAGDAARRRPRFSVANVASADWYQVVGGVTNLVASNTLSFRPTPESTAVGSHVFHVVARSAEGASSSAVQFTLTITGAPSAPQITGRIPKASADGLTLSNSDGDRTINPGDTVVVGTRAAQQFTADRTFRFNVNDGVNLKAAFTRWSLNGIIKTTNQSFVPELISGTNNRVSLTAYSQEGTAGTAREFTVTVTAAPAAPVTAPLLATRASCDTAATFTAQVDQGVRSIVWTAGPTNNSTQLRVNPAFISPASEPVSTNSYKYYAWAVSTNGDWSVSSTVVELTVVPAPPEAQLEGGRSVQTIALNATAYPALTVTNVGDNRLEWYLGALKVGEGSPFTPTTNNLPTSIPSGVISGVKEVRTHVLRAVMSRENCTNDTTTVTFQVIAPWLDASFTTNDVNAVGLKLHLNVVGDLAGKSVALYTTNNISLLAPAGTLPAGAIVLTPDALVAPVSTTNGINRYFIHTVTNFDANPEFFRVRVLP